uniref:Uncharacterized protein n=1 Tax=Periophthalmus magnuspinnatus TaxID=409849 RepID=A0A3B3Z833_9GOBI
MGAFLSALFNNVFGKKDMRILMVGEDAAGKTTILYKMKLGEIVTTIPTIGKFHFRWGKKGFWVFCVTKMEYISRTS